MKSMDEQNEIDEIVIAQTDDDEAWEELIVVRTSHPDTSALLSERVARRSREKFLDGLSSAPHVESDENGRLD